MAADRHDHTMTSDHHNPTFDGTPPSSYPQGFFVPNAGSCQVLLIRHGQSEPYISGSPFPLVDGHGDPRLTELGRAQAGWVGERLRTEPIEAIYVSSLTRTHETAAPLARHLGLTPTIVPDLREVFLGVAEGGRFREMSATNHPDVQRLRETGDWSAIPGAESNRQLAARTVAAVRSIADNHPDKMVAAFCHGGVINAILSYAIGSARLAFFGARHTSINHLVVEPSATADVDGPGFSGRQPGWIVRSFNDGAHAGTLSGDRPIG